MKYKKISMCSYMKICTHAYKPYSNKYTYMSKKRTPPATQNGGLNPACGQHGGHPPNGIKGYTAY